jgi:radical SAM protein with 4Fe4S-binding SPASM domain
MSVETAKTSIDWIFSNVPEGIDEIEITIIGGEALLEFDLIKEIVTYTCAKEKQKKIVFFATTNGTVLTSEMKEWFAMHKKCFHLGLSLDGNKVVHDHNRSNSFDCIDIEFFRKNWPKQTVKMTLSEFSLRHFADSIKYIHSLDFGIAGVNLFEGTFDWNKEEYINILAPQLKELVAYYVENNTYPLNQMFDKQLHYCEFKEKTPKKSCGVGSSINFFDVDGKMYPCNIFSPMTFPLNEIEEILKIDFTDENNFFDEYCYNNCYIYPICITCAGTNYINNKSFGKRDKRRCQIQKLTALFIADLQAKRILKDKTSFDNATLHYTIKAIKRIRELYLREFEQYL